MFTSDEFGGVLEALRGVLPRRTPQYMPWSHLYGDGGPCNSLGALVDGCDVHLLQVLLAHMDRSTVGVMRLLGKRLRITIDVCGCLFVRDA